ncbi:MAG: aminotransferase class V-fold PLP-dependent enzyme, partial [Gammaproteobacteria bacterium]|nr:aminotransferase class V-fold PLP-dependent enzyme [Gammaproteobacteria bacterium]
VRAHGALIHTDAVQALGKYPVDMSQLPVHMMSLSSHKIYGPKGVGALVVDKGVSFEPLLHGGGQEKGRRAGTENVAGIIGFGHAAELIAKEWQARDRQLLQLRQSLEASLSHAIEGVEIFSKEAGRVSNTCFFSVPGIDGEALLLALDDSGFAVSSGSACGSKDTEPSHVLMAMGIETELARGAVRISLGKENTEQQVEALVKAVQQQVENMRQLACTW